MLSVMPPNTSVNSSKYYNHFFRRTGKSRYSATPSSIELYSRTSLMGAI